MATGVPAGPDAPRSVLELGYGPGPPLLLQLQYSRPQ